ncbi:MAG TPA: carboxypeptidase regulatory-like domain-containing protein [Vicinamibacterales bacterium]|nr:carboxypeptidase regulatory-like domain-containing protein [Vicinamibacterales bacterium]
MRRSLAMFVCLALFAPASLAHAQGVQTGTITGSVKSADGLTLPGVTVTATSPELQGQRTAVTDVNGVYFIKGLPAGTYAVAFEISSFKPASTANVVLSVGTTVDVNQTMALAGVVENVTVTAEARPAPLARPTLSQVYSKSELEPLPVGRVPNQIADLAPGLTSNSPNVGQLSISGATGFDNVFMMNGVDINDNLFGTANTLFIEDAIQETNVLTGGISAEYGRFTGGVVNIITKSGGNSLSGSFRENFSNPRWIDTTPRQKSLGIENADVLSKTSEATLGGPVMRDRLWFFGSGRYENANVTNTFILSSASALRTDTNKRGEIKFTGTLAAGQTVSGDYTNNSLTQNNRFSLNSNSLDPSVLVNESQPNSLFVTNYNGVVANKLFATLQYSQKKFGFVGAGGTNTAITASPFLTRGVTPGESPSLNYAAPYFSALDPENRDNHQFTGSLSYTLSSKKTGTHDFKGGGEYYRSTRTGGNSQSATNYVFQADYLQAGGQPVYDSQGIPLPMFTPGVTRVQNWLPTIGAVININTSSFYVQDHWVASPRLSLDLGTRFEAVRSNATGGITTVDTTTIVPRFGATYDVEGNGKTVLQATYGHYAGKYTERQFGANTTVGNPSRVTYGYTGPAGQGRDFAPGFNLANYSTIISASFPTANIFVAPGLSSPTVREFTTSVGTQLNTKGFAKATYQFRRWYDFVEDEIKLSNGIVNVNQNGANIGNLTKVIYDNTNGVDREYQALVLQSGYRLRRSVTVAAHYTVQLKNNGNANEEAANQPGNTTPYGDYPEIIGQALNRYLPEGRLADFQRHKLRVYGTYTQQMGRFGSLDLSPIWRLDSGRVFSYVAASVPLTPIELARNPGYPANNINANTSYDLYFGDRGAGQFPGYGLLDLAATYSIPVWKSAKPWIKFEVYNALNNEKLIGWDTTVTPDPNSPKDANGLPTGYIQGANFGKAIQDNGSYAQPIPGTLGGRLFRMALGIRF